MTAQLEIRGVSKSFGGVQAVSRVSVDVQQGQILSIIGPNGAGKTTLLNCISSVFHPETGTIVLEGREITRLSPPRVAALGVARTFQNIRLFGQLTVWQNLWVAENRDRQQRAQPILPRWLWGCETDRERLGAALEF